MIMRYAPGPSLAGLAAIVQRFLPGIKDLYVWAFPLMALIVGISISIFIVAVKMRLRVESYETPSIELLFDVDRFQSCRQIDAVTLKGPREVRAILYRVGVRATGMKTIENVVVMLDDFSPQGAPFLPAPLHPMKSGLDAPADFTLHPSKTPTTFVEVIEKRSDSQEANIMYHANFRELNAEPLPTPIPPREYVFTLTARGKDVAPSTSLFRIAFDKEKVLKFEQMALHPVKG